MATGNLSESGDAAWGRVSAALAALFATPLGWLLLPVIMFTMAALAAVGVACLPTGLSVLGAALLARSRTHVPCKPLLAVALVLLGAAINVAVWNFMYRAWVADSAGNAAVAAWVL